MLNQGLEALAALAAASAGGASNGNQQRNNPSMNVTSNGSSVSRQQSGDQNGGDARLLAVAGAATQVGNAATNQQQSWQQTLAAGINQAALASPNLFQGLQQSQQASDPSALLAVQQQMAYLNYLVNAQSAKQNVANATQASSVPPPSNNPLAGLDANQALQLALTSRTAARLLQNQGT